MEILSDIIDKTIWPITLIVIVILLRKALSELVPNLKKLKYRDLELEFEKEATKILADTERDIPEIQPKVSEVAEDAESDTPDVLFKKDLRYSPASSNPLDRILISWRHIELKLREFVSDNYDRKRSITNILKELKDKDIINDEIFSLIRSLASLRNRVAHSKEEVISEEASNAYDKSCQRILDYLNQ